jgi:aspartate aminotransferase
MASRIESIKPSPSSMAGQRARELREAGRDIVSLTAGEPDFDTPLHIREAAVQAMAKSQTRYTDVGGTRALKTAIQDKFARDNGLDYALDEIIVGAGAKQIIFNALMSTVEAGDEVIIPVPYWVSYPDMVSLAGGTPVLVPCSPDHGFRLIADELESAITPRTRWLLLNAPNNPSGAIYSHAQLRQLADVLQRHPHVWVLTDDIYEHILYDDHRFATMAQIEPDLKARTLTVNGVSKAYAMTGWRIGYGAGPKALIGAMTSLQSQSTSNACSISQAAACAALTGPQELVREHNRIYQSRRDFMVAQLNQIPGLLCHAPQGAFYVFPSVAGLLGRRTPTGQTLHDDTEVAQYLLESHDLAVLHGEVYGLSPFLRLSFATSQGQLEEGCRRLRAACQELR